MAQTYPNFRYLLTGTSSGVIRTDNSTFSVPAANGTIFDRFDQYGISWRTYYDSLPAPARHPATPCRPRARANFVKGVQHFLDDAAAGRLPQFSFVNPDYESVSEENPQDVQFGDRFLARVTNGVLHSPQWRRTALFITYDEHGGYYDHVPPPRAVTPDDDPAAAAARRRARRLRPLRLPRAAHRRLAVGAAALRLAASSRTTRRSRASSRRSGTSARMTYRDANAADMTDYFDFRRPSFLAPPALPAPVDPAPGLFGCGAAGQHPPLPPAGAIA